MIIIDNYTLLTKSDNENILKDNSIPTVKAVQPKNSLDHLLIGLDNAQVCYSFWGRKFNLFNELTALSFVQLLKRYQVLWDNFLKTNYLAPADNSNDYIAGQKYLQKLLTFKAKLIDLKEKSDEKFFEESSKSLKGRILAVWIKCMRIILFFKCSNWQLELFNTSDLIKKEAIVQAHFTAKAAEQKTNQNEINKSLH